MTFIFPYVRVLVGRLQKVFCFFNVGQVLSCVSASHGIFQRGGNVRWITKDWFLSHPAKKVSPADRVLLLRDSRNVHVALKRKILKKGLLKKECFPYVSRQMFFGPRGRDLRLVLQKKMLFGSDDRDTILLLSSTQMFFRPHGRGFHVLSQKLMSLGRKSGRFTYWFQGPH